MKTLPTPELLSAVLDIELRKGKHSHDIIFSPTKSLLGWQELYLEGNDWDTKANSINIHELAHKCKEWAIALDKEIHTYITKEFKSDSTSQNVVNFHVCNFCDQRLFSGYSIESEPEAIFKACQWIYEEKGGEINLK